MFEETLVCLLYSSAYCSRSISSVPPNVLGFVRPLGEARPGPPGSARGISPGKPGGILPPPGPPGKDGSPLGIPAGRPLGIPPETPLVGGRPAADGAMAGGAPPAPGDDDGLGADADGMGTGGGPPLLTPAAGAEPGADAPLLKFF